MGDGLRVRARSLRRLDLSPQPSPRGRGTKTMFLFQAGTPDINLTLIAPELIVGFAGVLVMMVDAFASRNQRWLTGTLSIISLVAAAVSSFWLWSAWPSQPSAFNGMIVLDELRLSFTLIFLVVALL